jgi:hypothetical protein
MSTSSSGVVKHLEARQISDAIMQFQPIAQHKYSQEVQPTAPYKYSNS